MAVITRKINISCSPTEAWEVLSAFGEISSWASNVSHSCLLSNQQEGVGTFRRIQTGNSSVTEHVMRWDDSRFFVVITFLTFGEAQIIGALFQI